MHKYFVILPVLSKESVIFDKVLPRPVSLKVFQFCCDPEVFVGETVAARDSREGVDH